MDLTNLHFLILSLWIWNFKPRALNPGLHLFFKTILRPKKNKYTQIWAVESSSNLSHASLMQATVQYSEIWERHISFYLPCKPALGSRRTYRNQCNRCPINTYAISTLKSQRCRVKCNFSFVLHLKRLTWDFNVMRKMSPEQGLTCWILMEHVPATSHIQTGTD